MTTYESYVEGTQRGYAYGLRRDGERIHEGYVASKTLTGLDGAYAEASRKAASLLETAKRRPDLIHRNVFDRVYCRAHGRQWCTDCACEDYLSALAKEG